MKKKVLCIVGTRPEVIKMAPIVHHLKNDSSWTTRLLTTAQHREMLDQMLKVFDLAPDIDLNLMQFNQTLPQLTANLPLPLDKMLEQENPDIVLAQGDTTTAFMVSLACFYRQIPFAHVEAGLRTGSLYNPFPEEMNRVLISRLSALNFAPTENAKLNLIKEGYPEQTIFVTGNTVIDALHLILKKDIPIDPRIKKDKRLILITAHRRENFGPRLENICKALLYLADKYEDIQLLYPVHPNPQVKETVGKMLASHPRILLTEPLSYEVFVKAMQRAYLIISDSGGVQEEAPTIKTPVLVIRETTERPEAVAAGASRLVGTSAEKIIQAAELLLDSEAERCKMLVETSPYGDGKASSRIVNIIHSFCGIS